MELPTLSEQDFDFYINCLINQINQYPDHSKEHEHNRMLLNKMGEYAFYRRTLVGGTPLTWPEFAELNGIKIN